jgi:2-phospho-L-lactate/phosphoenolpyruvate guanylyltransferase
VIGRAVVIVPIRSLAGGKTRLAGALTQEERQQLTEQMLRQVIGAALDSFVEPVVLVISPDEAALKLSQTLGPRVRPLVQPYAKPGLNNALFIAKEAAIAGGAATILVLPADLPLLSSDDIQHLLRRDAPVVIAPDRHGKGTNALLIRLDGPGRDFTFLFGEESYGRHMDEAHRLGLDAATAVAMGTSFDLDTAADLDLLTALTPTAAEVEGEVVCGRP